MATNHPSSSVIQFIEDELHAILSAIWGGARYGMKIRLPHALVMTFLFRRRLSVKEKLQNILTIAWEHASNLAMFAALYKTILFLLKWSSRHLVEINARRGTLKYFGKILLSMLVNGPLPGEERILTISHVPPGHPQRTHHALIAGAVGGYFIWGRYSSLNYQILLYLSSRVIAGLVKRFQGDRKLSPRAFSVFSATIWAMVMLLFEECPEVLHPSLKSSMDEIYRFSLSSDKNGT